MGIRGWISRPRKYATGGKIPGAVGSPTDDRVAYLTQGCVVVSDATLAKYGREHLEALNGGNTRILSVSEALEEEG